jgi:hypothetical protein
MGVTPSFFAVLGAENGFFCSGKKRSPEKIGIMTKRIQ